MGKFWEKPSLLEGTLLFLSFCLIGYGLHDLGLFSWLFMRDNPQGVIYDFQVFLGGLLAFGAGIFVWIAAKARINYEKKKDKEAEQKYRAYYAREARMIASENLENIKTLKSDKKSSTALSSMKQYRRDFLIDVSHISYLNKTEIWCLSDLENDQIFVDLNYEILEEYAKIFPDKPFKEIFDIATVVKNMSDLAKNAKSLSKFLDLLRHNQWFEER